MRCPPGRHSIPGAQRIKRNWNNFCRRLYQGHLIQRCEDGARDKSGHMSGCRGNSVEHEWATAVTGCPKEMRPHKSCASSWLWAVPVNEAQIQRAGRRMTVLKRFCCYALAVFLTSQSHAQMPANSPYWIAWNQAQARDTANANGYANMGFAPPLMSIRGKPFTATRVWTDELTPAGQNSEGNIRTLSAELTIARDSKGRIHTEMAFQDGPNSSLVKLDVYIYDPVAHTVYRYFTTPDHALPAKPEAHLTHLQLMSELSQPIQSTGDQKAAARPESEPENTNNSANDKARESRGLANQPVFSSEPQKAPPDFGGKEARQIGETTGQAKEEAHASTLPAPNSVASPLTEE